MTAINCSAAPSFWNENDPHLKERFFGLTPFEGNHGEDVKEYYFHVDNTPTHSYMSLRYRYPQRAFPYEQLVDENQRRQGQGPEYELLDTGVFADGRWFDILIEYAKATTEEIAIRITATNRGPDPAPLQMLPTLWFRNTWSWGPQQLPQPRIRAAIGPSGTLCLEADDNGMFLDPRIPNGCRLGRRWLITAADSATVLATDNETNGPVVYAPAASAAPRLRRMRSTASSAAVSEPPSTRPWEEQRSASTVAGWCPRRLCRDASGAHRPATGRGRAADHHVRVDR